jgi:hypothetical protein
LPVVQKNSNIFCVFSQIFTFWQNYPLHFLPSQNIRLAPGINLLILYLSIHPFLIGEILLSVEFLSEDKAPTFVLCCSNLFVIGSPDLISIAVKILQHFYSSEQITNLIIKIFASITNDSLLAVALQSLSVLLDHRDIPPFFGHIREFFGTNCESLREAICEFLETVIDRLFLTILDPANLDFVIN